MIAEDNSALTNGAAAAAKPDFDALGQECGGDDRPTRALLLGWNERAAIVVSELDKHAAPGSTLTVLTSYGVPAVGELREHGSHRRRRLAPPTERPWTGTSWRASTR